MSDKSYNVEETHQKGVCGEPTEVYSRVTGYFRPVSNWNHGKKEEFKDRKLFNIEQASAACHCASSK